MKKKNFGYFLIASTVIVSTCLSMETQGQEQKKAFFKAVNTGDERIVKEILTEHQTLVNAQNHLGETPLHCAIDSVSRARINYRIARRIAARLLRAGADIEARDNKGLSPLFYAIRTDNLHLAYFLVAFGADIDATKDGGLTMFEYTVQSWQRRWESPGKLPEIALLLLERGAAKEDGNLLIDPFLEKRNVNCQDRQLYGGKRYFKALEVASAVTKFPREVNKIIVSMLAKPWAENIETIAKAVPESEILKDQEKQEQPAVEKDAPVAQNDQESTVLSLISAGWEGIARLDESLQTFLDTFRRNRA